MRRQARVLDSPRVEEQSSTASLSVGVVTTVKTGMFIAYALITLVRKKGCLLLEGIFVAV